MFSHNVNSPTVACWICYASNLAYNLCRFASSSWRQSKRNSMVGSGFVQMVAKSATTDMPFLQAMFWNLRWRHFLRQNLKRLPLRMRLKTRWLSLSESYIFLRFFSVPMETLCTFATTCIASPKYFCFYSSVVYFLFLFCSSTDYCSVQK